MDEKVATWIIEFLLRKPIDEKIINGVLSRLPLSINDNGLKKTILLRKIETETLNGSVSEKLLELLEIIEELDHREGKVASNMMREAYCLVAVDCTVRFLEENVEENGKYFEAVERIWRSRVCLMDGLASENSNRWLGNIEAAVWDSGVCEKIWMRNTRNDALKAVKGYLKEAWEVMGPAFLESLANKIGNEVEEFCRGKDGGDTVVGSQNPCNKSVVSQGTKKGKASVRYKHVAVKSKRPRGAKISDPEEGEGAKESINVADDVPARKTDKVQETLQSSPMQLCAAVNDIHVDATQAACTVSLTKVNDNTNNVNTPQSSSMQLCAAVNDIHVDASQAACTVSSTKVKDNTSNVNTVKNKIGFVKHTTAEVNRAQYALRSSSRGLHAAVTDPLPEAFKIAETLSVTGVTGNHDTAVENQTTPEMHTSPRVDSLQQAPESSSVEGFRNPSPDASVPGESIDKNIEYVEKKRNSQGNGVDDKMEGHKRKRSLMERNETSHTLEWDDSIDNLSEGLPDRLCLPPSGNRSNASPLRLYEEKKIRRTRKMWTPQEEDALRDAVKKFGQRWTMIHNCYNEVFKDRTDVDLKDKWRNMTKSKH